MPNKNQRVILVTGASGHQGGAVLRRLRERAFPVRALVRNPDDPKARGLTGPGTEVVRGDLNDQASISRTMDGAHGVFSVQTHEHGVDAEVRQGINVADAAKRQRINHLVYSSVAGAEQRTGISFFDSKFRIEEHLRGTGIHYTIFRPVFFMENWMKMREQIERGTISMPLHPDTPLRMLALDDLGAFVTMAFEHPGKWQGRSMELAGDEVPLSQIAATFSRITGRDVRYVPMPWDEFEQQHDPDMVKMYRFFESDHPRTDISGIRQEHPGLLSFDRWLNTRWLAARAA